MRELYLLDFYGLDRLRDWLYCCMAHHKVSQKLVLLSGAALLVNRGIVVVRSDGG